jgi:hypothetical protein
MGLLDSLMMGSRGGYGGLLDALMYQSPLLQKQEQPMPDTMAGFVQPEPQSPFGPTPQLSPIIPPAPVLPPSVFNQGTAGVPGLPQNMAPAAPPLPPAQTVAPVPPPQTDPSPSMNIGGYQMPQIGTMADYTPVGGSSTDISAQSRQPPQEAPQQQQQTLPPAFGGGPSIGRMFNPDGLIARLTGNDSRSIAQQNLKAQYDSLVPMLGPQKAMLAVMNPKAGEILLAQALEKRQYGFIKTDAGEIVRTDPLKGTVESAYGSGSTNSAGVAGPDGKIIPYPEGLDTAGKKTFANEIARINADAAAGKKTEVQAKSEKFGNRMEMAEKNLRGLDTEGTSLTNRGLEALPGGVGNLAQSEKFQKFKQARSAFIQAMLRDESGAAIQTPEFARLEREMFPQPGDTRDVIAQKAEARKVAIEAMKKSAGPGYKSPESTPSGASRSDFEAEIRRRGLMK